MEISDVLKGLQIAPVVKGENFEPIDLSGPTVAKLGLDLGNRVEIESWFYSQTKKSIRYGGYLEKRSWYGRNPDFVNGAEVRNIHLGMDLWCSAGSNIHAPIKGKIHSYQFNDAPGDYGHTLILEHHISGFKFYTLYGHLAAPKITDKGHEFNPGDAIAQVGSWEENGSWPPHLHFQIIIDMEGKVGDYPGVCHEKEKGQFAKNCPHPMLLLPMLP
ncbi:peptidoglycan DD-metalloendopeptidase family protein [Luteibaculum oceani]|uniref:Peptidoglycan DD-metalloendopeptidase family protein n=1 Tax=Luteibaculum oceani TaxID=1294296 RepID=A0A5C6VKT7_9FLAO|nr:peptidoglycan DD-metalloendopeptidase family protein [Luteibaculum oceani]TXC85381.1 peptidoglycan DD-metalloendopeptidase family protein [Luteibaculum oceani]